MGMEILKGELYVEIIERNNLEMEIKTNKNKCVFMGIEEFKPIPVQRSNGPSSINQMHEFIMKLNRSVRSRKNKSKTHKVVVHEQDELGSALFLVTAYLMFMRHLKLDVIENCINLDNVRFCDCTGKFHLTLRDYIHGLEKAMTCDIYDPYKYKLHENKFYEEWQNGNINEVVANKLFVMPTPEDNSEYYSSPELYLDYFIKRDITMVIRLCKEQHYHKASFEDEGIEVVDLSYEDGGDPPSYVIKEFLRLMLLRGRHIAMHCKAGLGRAGTLAAIFMIRHMGMTSAEAISYLRMIRPGSVLGLQAIFIQFAELLTMSADRDSWEKLDGILDDAMESEGEAPWRAANLSQADWLNKAKLGNQKQMERSRAASPLSQPQDKQASLTTYDNDKTFQLKNIPAQCLHPDRTSRRDQPWNMACTRKCSPDRVTGSSQREGRFNKSRSTVTNTKKEQNRQAPDDSIKEQHVRKPSWYSSQNTKGMNEPQFNSTAVNSIEERGHGHQPQTRQAFIKGIERQNNVGIEWSAFLSSNDPETEQKSLQPRPKSATSQPMSIKHNMHSHDPNINRAWRKLRQEQCRWNESPERYQEALKEREEVKTLFETWNPSDANRGDNTQNRSQNLVPNSSNSNPANSSMYNPPQNTPSSKPFNSPRNIPFELTRSQPKNTQSEGQFSIQTKSEVRRPQSTFLISDSDRVMYNCSRPEFDKPVRSDSNMMNETPSLAEHRLTSKNQRMPQYIHKYGESAPRKTPTASLYHSKPA